MSTSEELRLVFVGKTGSGKSATANTIAQKKGLFKSASDGQAVTVSCQCEKSDFQGQRLLLTDTPGLFDTSRSHEDIKKEIGSFVRVTAPGPHAILVVMSAANRFTEEEINVIKKLKEMFGKDIENYIIIIITRTENWEEDGMTPTEFLKSLPDQAKEVLHVALAAGRAVAFQNRLKEDNPRKTEQVKELLCLIKTTVERNGNKYYTAELWQKAEEEMKKRQEEIKAQEMAEEVKKVEEMEKRLWKQLEDKFTKKLEELDRAAKEAEKQHEREMTLKMEQMLLDHTERMEKIRAKEAAQERMMRDENLARMESNAARERIEKQRQDVLMARVEAEQANMERIALEYRRIDEAARERARWEEANRNKPCVVL